MNDFFNKVSNNEKDLLILMSIGFSFSSILSGFGLLLPIGIWFIKKDDFEKVNLQGKSLLNYSFLLIFLFLITAAISFYTSAIVITFLVPIYSVIVSIFATQAALRGEVLTYPKRIYRPIK